MVEETRNY